MADKNINKLLEQAESNGVLIGIKLMQERMLLACKNGTPIELPDGRVYWVQSDIEHLRAVMDSIK